MMRNDLITLLGEKDNDTVVVDVNGQLVDIDGVTVNRDCIALVLNPEKLQHVLSAIASRELDRVLDDAGTTPSLRGDKSR